MVGPVTETESRVEAARRCWLTAGCPLRSSTGPSSSGSTGIRHQPVLKYPTAALSKGASQDEGNVLYLCSPTGLSNQPRAVTEHLGPMTGALNVLFCLILITSALH